MRRSALFLATLALAACGYSDRELAGLWSAAPARAQAATPAPAPAATPNAAPAAPAPAPAEIRTPFVVIPFGGGAPEYAGPLYQAMTGALKRKPDVAFDLVAVTSDPRAAERNLGAVLHTMTAMGFPAARVTLAAAAPRDSRTDEVWIYVR